MGFEATSLAAPLVVGASLGLAGAALQSTLRNPLAEPYLLGTVGGAALAASLAVVAGVGAFGGIAVSLCAFGGSCASLALVCLVAWLASRGKGVYGFPAETVSLAGFAVGSIAGSAEMVVISHAPAGTFESVSKWLFGDLSRISPHAFAFACVALAVSAIALYSQNRNLDSLALGDVCARSLGVDVRKTYIVSLGAASLATAASVSLAGAIGFVGLITPHAARRIFGCRHCVYLPASMAGGALFLFAAQQLLRFMPEGSNAGIVCALSGGPFFLFLLARRARQ